LKFVAGVKVTVPASRLLVPFTGDCTEITLRLWPASFGGPAVSFVSRSAAGKLSAASSGVAFASVAAVGGSLTWLTLTVTSPLSDFGSARLLVVPLSVTV
jgi:hypothetical protein